MKRFMSFQRVRSIDSLITELRENEFSVGRPSWSISGKSTYYEVYDKIANKSMRLRTAGFVQHIPRSKHASIYTEDSASRLRSVVRDYYKQNKGQLARY